MENEQLSLLLVLDVVLEQSSEVPFHVLLASGISPSVFAFALRSQASKRTRGHVGPPVCPLTWNCHGALAAKCFCGRWCAGRRVGPSVSYKRQVLGACWFAEL